MSEYHVPVLLGVDLSMDWISGREVCIWGSDLRGGRTFRGDIETIGCRGMFAGVRSG